MKKPKFDPTVNEADVTHDILVSLKSMSGQPPKVIYRKLRKIYSRNQINTALDFARYNKQQ